MPVYRVAGQAIHFSIPLPELGAYEIEGAQQEYPEFSNDVNSHLVSQVTGLVGSEMRRVEVWSGAFGFLLKVAGGGDVNIHRDGKAILLADKSRQASGLDREIFLGPAVVFALALCGAWSLHASAAMFGDRLLVLLGESGQGKSTLASYLANSGERGWRWVADDILPVTARGRVDAWPHFAQLKVPLDSQPGVSLPEQIPVDQIYLLKDAELGQSPALELLKPGRAVPVLAGHTAGARLFDQDMLARHLAFAGEAARLVPVYEMIYPRRPSALAEARRLLETPC